MPRTDVVFYQETEGDVPVLDWLKKLAPIGSTGLCEMHRLY
jgi:hypothetical protein